MTITISAVSIEYDTKKVISDVNMAFQPGKIHTILGPNGCGKSTLLKTVGKHLKPSEGNILLQGRNINTLSRKNFARELAFFMQVHTSNPEITVRQLVEYGRFPYKKAFESLQADDQVIIEESLRVTDMLRFADRIVTNLSGGERQRAWLAMNLAQEPSVLLLDEPTSFLDIQYQLEILELIQSLNTMYEMTIVVVLHDLNHAAMISDQITVLKDGNVYNSGIPADVLTQQMLREVFHVDASVTVSSDRKNVVLHDFKLYRP